MKLTKRQNKRLMKLVLPVFLVAFGGGLILWSMEDALVFFYTPTRIKLDPEISKERRIRLGGLVKKGSFVQQDLGAVFVLTDGNEDIPVVYSGTLPSLFREGQGVVALGTYDPKTGLAATEVLAKHDETYMPPEVVAGLKEQGYWQHAPQNDPMVTP